MRLPLAVEERLVRLLRMLVGVEEAIARLEADGGSEDLIRRLRVVEDEICEAFQLLAGELSEAP